LSSWWWAVCRPKHVEQLRNIGIINSTTRWHLVCSFYEIYTTMHGSMNIKFIDKFRVLGRYLGKKSWRDWKLEIRWIKEKAAVRAAKQSYEKEICDVPGANPAAVENSKLRQPSEVKAWKIFSRVLSKLLSKPLFEFWCFRTCVTEDAVLLWNDALSTGEGISTFQGHYVISKSRNAVINWRSVISQKNWFLRSLFGCCTKGVLGL